MAFVGLGGDIEGVVNPTLRVNDGDVVQVSLINNDGIEHDVVFSEFNAGTDRVNRKGASSVTVFRADKSGEFLYFCSLPGHRQAGMEGKLVVGGARGPAVTLPPSTSIVRAASDLPGPLPPGRVRSPLIWRRSNWSAGSRTRRRTTTGRSTQGAGSVFFAYAWVTPSTSTSRIALIAA